MKVPEPRQLKSGSWFIQLRLGGESVPVTAPTKQQCLHTAETIKAAHRAGLRAEKAARSDLTLKQSIDEYIKAKSNSLSPATIRAYRNIQKTRFQDYMDRPMKSIRNWQAVYDSQPKTLSGKTMKNAWSLIRSVYKLQTGQSMPEISMRPVVQSDRPFLDAEQISAFLKVIDGRPCEIPALLALSSLRCSELLALTWDKVDLKKKTIQVAGALVPDEHNKLVHKETNKTESSRRVVPIFIPQLQTALERVKIRDGFVSPYRTQQTTIRNINAACRDAGVPEVGIHGLRHSFASLCVHLGIPEETAMKIGGWSDFQTMRKIYTHISDRDLIQHTADLTNFFKNANKNANENSDPLKNQGE